MAVCDEQDVLLGRILDAQGKSPDAIRFPRFVREWFGQSGEREVCNFPIKILQVVVLGQRACLRVTDEDVVPRLRRERRQVAFFEVD